MTQLLDDWSHRLHRLRRSFDEAFELPPPAASQQQETLLAIEAGGTPLALRIAELSRLEAGRKVVPVPTACAELLGLAGVRGRLVPVYSLASLLGLSDRGDERWLVLCGGEIADGKPASTTSISASDPIALAFGALQGHARVARTEIFAVNEDARPVIHATELVRLDGVTRPLVSIASVTKAIRDRQRTARPGRDADSPTSKERGR